MVMFVVLAWVGLSHGFPTQTQDQALINVGSNATKGTQSQALIHSGINATKQVTKQEAHAVAACKANEQGKSYSSSKQDKWVYENLFYGKTAGTFAEIGAYDGQWLSNLKFYEESLCWKGVCVEPIDTRFANVQKVRSCAAYNGAVCDRTGKKEFWHVDAKGKASGFDTWSGFPDKMSDFSKNRINELVKTGSAKINKVDMQCYSLADLMQQNKMDHIDLVSLDVENHELAVLQTWDLQKMNIGAIIVEASQPKEITDHMRANGYELATKIDDDLIFKNTRMKFTSKK